MGGTILQMGSFLTRTDSHCLTLSSTLLLFLSAFFSPSLPPLSFHLPSTALSPLPLRFMASTLHPPRCDSRQFVCAGVVTLSTGRGSVLAFFLASVGRDCLLRTRPRTQCRTVLCRQKEKYTCLWLVLLQQVFFSNCFGSSAFSLGV